MAMLGMQSDMQCRYVPGYHTSRDLNLNASWSNWPLHNVDSIVKNGHYNNGSWRPVSPNLHFGSKEILKQKMLQHEAIFRDQICELHRLYNRQRELMDEIKRSELYRHQLQLEILQSTPILCPNSFEYSQKAVQVSALSCLNPACSPSSVSGAENNMLHLSCGQEEAAKAVWSPAQTEGNTKEPELLQFTSKKFGKKVLDLELPADEYIDSEEEEHFPRKKVLNLPEVRTSLKKIFEHGETCDGKPSSDSYDLNLVLQEDNITRASFSGKIKGLADLNEPIKLEAEIDLNSDFQDPVLGQRGIPCQRLSGKTNPDFQLWPEESPQNTQTRGGLEAVSDSLALDKKERREGWPSNNDEAGQSSSDLNLFPEGMRVEASTSLSEDIDTEQCREISMSHLGQSGSKLQSKRKFSSLESLESHFTIDSDLEQVVTARNDTSNQLVLVADVMNYGSSLVSSHRKQTRNFVRTTIAVQALRCRDTSVRLSRNSKYGIPIIAGDRSCYMKNLKSNPKLCSASVQSSLCINDYEFTSEDNGIKRHIMGCVDEKLSRDIDLNVMSASCSSDEAVESSWINNGATEFKDSTESSDWIGAKSVHIGKHSIRMESVNLHDNADEDDNNGEKDGVPRINLDCNSLLDFRERLTANEQVIENRRDKKFSGFGFRIDLNSGINEDEAPPTPSLSTELYLEEPANPENNETSPSRGESDGNQLEALVQLSGQEYEELPEEVIEIAAKAIVSISSSRVQTCPERATSNPSESSQINSLYWFARITSSVVDDPEGQFGVALSCKDADDPGECFSCGIDYFEAMTLKLEETKVEEYYCNTNVQKDEEMDPTSLPGQSRKGRTRMARQQRKDFRSEVLPSLASLSRHEVTQDLQAIGGLIEAACPCSNKGARQIGRNGWTRGRRMRRRTPSVSSSDVESPTCIPSNQQTEHVELGIMERGIIEWGKITRKRRGQRFPSSNPRLILGQV